MYLQDGCLHTPAREPSHLVVDVNGDAVPPDGPPLNALMEKAVFCPF